jgi:ornithine cyclodeaminase/alanine dehydrogenase-like protein (mu-crystallin family)
VEALLQVRPIRRLRAYDLDSAAAAAFCNEMRLAHSVDCACSATVHEATAGSAIVVTTTPSKQPIIGVDDVDRGTFIAAVGADSEDKQELSVDLLRSGVVVVDDIDQCAGIGDLHHAIHTGVMTISDVRASLDEVVSGRVAGRHDDSEIIIFDSTGVAIEDAAAGAVVYDKAQAAGVGISISLAGIPLAGVDQRPIQ